MRQPWGKSNVDGANFTMAESELDRMYDEMPRLPEPPAQAEGEGGAAPGPPPRTQTRTIAPPPPSEEPPVECSKEGCAVAFQNASESGAPLVGGSGSGCDCRQSSGSGGGANTGRRPA